MPLGLVDLVCACAWQVEECHIVTVKGCLAIISSCQKVNAGKSHLSAVTVISSPVSLMVQLYLGTSAASISNPDAVFRSSTLAAAGRLPSLELAVRISLNQVVTVPTSSRVPGMVGWSELGRVTNLGLSWQVDKIQFDAAACSSGGAPASGPTTI